VRKNRTPGSVRGASGNWRPYRDGERRKSHDRTQQADIVSSGRRLGLVAVVPVALSAGPAVGGTSQEGENVQTVR
jgi:hypothetical protein